MNKGEGRHRLGRTVFHGQRGELRQRYREGQEDQLGALGLVLNALILWNTRYMDAALSHLRAQGKEIKPEDEARLSPLGNKHFNVLGRYHFHVTDSILKGELRYVLVPMIVGPRGIQAGDRQATRGQQNLGTQAPCRQNDEPEPKIKVRVRILHE